MKINRFMIAAPKSGSGKTMITCALLQLLKDSGKNVLSYKCGPDYIDPMFHKRCLAYHPKISIRFLRRKDNSAAFLR